ncbi:SWIM zinc finger family protein [Candidatus Poriferisodalis sp.]|uniref:SWIM zinc finger family protein n=1 Tax=Candidatus Poriferisodalis sp. TaxID=3101277 RepID=UPI003D106924
MVRGTVPYIVELWTDNGEPRWSCTCPAAKDGSFCKHCVATALTLLPRSSEPGVRQERASTGRGSQKGGSAPVLARPSSASGCGASTVPSSLTASS